MSTLLSACSLQLSRSRMQRSCRQGAKDWCGDGEGELSPTSVIERRTPDYVRNGTSTLSAALDVATSKITAARKPRHRNQEFLAFLSTCLPVAPHRARA